MRFFPFFFLLFATATLADQDVREDTVYTIGEVLITTDSGIKKEAVRQPLTIDTVEPTQAAADQAVWVGETLIKLPGVYFAKLRGVVDAPAIRQPVSYDNTYLYLQDNVPFQSPISFNHAAFSYSGAMTSFGGMEVLKGPGSALHGSDALAAVINVKSLEPTSKRGADLRLAGGQYGNRELKAEFCDGLGEHQAWRLAASYHGEGGWRENTGWDRLQAIARHRYQNAGTEVNTILTATRFDSEMAGTLGQEVFDADPTADGLDPEVDRGEAADQALHLRLSSEIKRPFLGDELLSITPFIRYIDSQYMHTWEPAVTPVTTEKTTTFGLLNRAYLYRGNGAETILGLDLDLTNLDRLTDQTRPTKSIWGTDYLQGTQYDFSVNYLNLAPYLQHSQQLGPRLLLVAGLRYERASYDYDNQVAAGAVGARYRPADRQDDFSQLNPKLGLTYFLDEANSLYTRYAHGFRIPGSGTLYALSAGQADFTLDPEKMDSYEVGYKGRLREHLYASASAYFMRSTDGIAMGVSTPAGEISANGGEREYKGLELSLFAQPISHLDLELTYGYSAHQIVKYRADGPSELDGNTPMSSPAHLGNLRLTWRPPALNQRLSLQTEFQYLGAWYMDDANTQQTDPALIPHLRLSCRLSPALTLTGKVLNLTDKRYASTAELQPWGLNLRPGQNRTLTLGLETSW
ncbi:MAG: TonB-dependent receptor [Candidatus Handelsmanbacteria bacterium]|nr:TonB-dependent receptor [Candidatus Handelsmanbacteria bacterium]